MPSLKNDRLTMVRALIETAPDHAVRSLGAALKAEGKDSVLASVSTLVQTELTERTMRDAVVAPIRSLCAPRADGFQQVLFPAGLMPRLWKGMKGVEPRSASIVASSLTLSADEENYPPACDKLCREGARAIRERHPEMAETIRYLEDYRAGSAEQFAGFLELAPLVRKALPRLPVWLRSMNGENAAAVRLLFKDADAIARDAGPRLMEVLLSHMKEPWPVLRLVSAVTKGAGDRYLASSEMAGICERVMFDIDRHIQSVRLFDADGGPEAGAAAAAALAKALTALGEFDISVELNKDGPWGARLGKQKALLASLSEGYLKKTFKAVNEALPTQPVRAGGTALRNEPRLELMPDPRLVGRAITGLAFFDKTRGCAAQGGFGTARTKVGEDITYLLDTYLEDVLAGLHSGGDSHFALSQAYMEVIASFMALAQDEKSAQIVRRRAAAA